MEQAENIPVFNIPGKLFQNISRDFNRDFFPNILGISHWNVPRTFHEHIFVQWVT